MNNRITQILVGSDSRYLTPEETARGARLYPRFRRAAQDRGLIEENEDGAVRFCIDNTRKRYPNFDNTICMPGPKPFAMCN